MLIRNKGPALDPRVLQKERIQRREALWRGFSLVLATICIVLAALLVGHEGLLRIIGLPRPW